MCDFWATEEEDFPIHTRFPNEEVFKLFWESFSPAASERRYRSNTQTTVCGPASPYRTEAKVFITLGRRVSNMLSLVLTPLRGTRDAACQTESAGVLHIETNPSRRSKALQVRVPDHSVYCSTDDLEVVGSKPTKRWRHYDTESSDGSPPHLPLPDDVTDWHANSESLWSGAELRVTDSPSSQADGGAWVKVTVKNEGEDIPLAGGRQEENKEQEDRKPPVSSAAGPLSNVSALSETPSPCPRSLGPGKKNVKEEETETTVKDEETLAVGGDSGTP
ncbi:unnamed protein product [Lota lota]